MHHHVFGKHHCGFSPTLTDLVMTAEMAWEASRKGMVPVERLKQLCADWGKRDAERNLMGFDWMYMNAIDDLEQIIEEFK